MAGCYIELGAWGKTVYRIKRNDIHTLLLLGMDNRSTMVAM